MSLLHLFAAVCSLGAFICWIIILVAAFKDEVWKGLLSLICGLYQLYYAIFEFEYEHKWPVVLGWLFLGGAGSAFVRAVQQ